MGKATTDIYSFRKLREQTRAYAAKYGLASKPVTKIGISFSSERRTIAEVKVG